MKKTIIALAAAGLVSFGGAAVAGNAEAGKALYTTCAGCHGAQGEGMGAFPKLAGKSADYIKDKLHKYKAGEQVGPQTAIMAPNAQGLSDEDIENLAAYIATFK